MCPRTAGNHLVTQAEIAPEEGGRSRGTQVAMVAEMVVGLRTGTRIQEMEHRGATQTESEAGHDALSRKHG